MLEVRHDGHEPQHEVHAVTNASSPAITPAQAHESLRRKKVAESKLIDRLAMLQAGTVYTASSAGRLWELDGTTAKKYLSIGVGMGLLESHVAKIEGHTNMANHYQRTAQPLPVIIVPERHGDAQRIAKQRPGIPELWNVWNMGVPPRKIHFKMPSRVHVIGISGGRLVRDD